MSILLNEPDFYYTSILNEETLNSSIINLNGVSGVLKGVNNIIQGSSITDDLPEGKTNLYFTTARAQGAFSSGTGIIITTGTISNTGVLSLTGTANRITVSAATGNITLSTPQDINTTSSPTFNSITASNILGLQQTLCLLSTDVGGNVLNASTGSSLSYDTTYRTINTIQDIRNTASPTFAGLTLGTLSGILKATAGVVTNGATTDDLTEGKTNLYFTNNRARAAITAAAPIYAISGIISIGYNTSNLKLTLGGNLDTIQDIGTGSSPQFARLLNSSIGTRNLLLGTSAGNAITTSVDSVAIGNNALSTLSTAINCTAVGSQTLTTCNANNNTAVGFKASNILTSGFQNTTVGAFAGGLLTTGKYNNLFGMSAGYNISSGDTNFCLGLNAGYSITTSSDNIAIGAYTMAKNLNPITTTNGRNVAIGHYASHSLEGTPENNITIGYQSMWNATSCSSNICIGTNAGNSITTGGGNIAIGSSSLSTGGTLTAGQGGNIGLGISSNLYVSAGATNNIGIGSYSNLNTSTGVSNISIGPYTQASSATGNNQITISTNGISGTPISGKGDNTAFIDARSGLFSYNPVIAQFTFINSNPQIAVNPNYLPYYSYGISGSGTVPYFNRGITITTNLNATIGGYWRFQQLGIYKITVSMKQYSQTTSKTTFIGRTATLGSASITILGATPWTTYNNVEYISWNITTLITVSNLTDYYFITEFFGIAVNSYMNNNASVLIEYVSVG